MRDGRKNVPAQFKLRWRVFGGSGVLLHDMPEDQALLRDVRLLVVGAASRQSIEYAARRTCCSVQRTPSIEETSTQSAHTSGPVHNHSRTGQAYQPDLVAWRQLGASLGRGVW